MPTKLIQSTTLVLAVASATFLGACDRTDTRDEMRGSDRPSSQNVTPHGTANASRSTEAVGTTTSDMAITAGVKTRLAADTQLSALAINVDTSAGRVALRGKAPDSAARTHATELARSVEGVVDVDNALTVQVTAK